MTFDLFSWVRGMARRRIAAGLGKAMVARVFERCQEAVGGGIRLNMVSGPPGHGTASQGNHKERVSEVKLT